MASSKKPFTRVLRDHVTARANLLQAITQHPTLVGAGRERAVMEMLRGQLPRRYEVLTGTILGHEGGGSWQKDNRQIDVMVVDTFDYPTVLRDGDIAVVLPQAVRVVIEVKSDLVAPPDLDEADAKQGAGAKEAGEDAEPEEPDSEADDAAEQDEDSPDANEPARGKTKKKETFLDAVKQVARNRSLFDDQVPALTILLSHKAPAGNATLRGWLANVMKARRKLADKLGTVENGSKEHAKLKGELARLDPALFPDVIIADKGALAIRAGTAYDFFVTGEDRASAPGLVTLVWYVLEHLDRQDTPFGSSDEAWRGLRKRAKDLFRTVMEPTKSGDRDTPSIELDDVGADPGAGPAAARLPEDADAQGEGGSRC